MVWKESPEKEAARTSQRLPSEDFGGSEYGRTRKQGREIKAIVILSNTIEVEREGFNISTWSGLLV
jgi:hypothetical protein